MSSEIADDHEVDTPRRVSMRAEEAVLSPMALTIQTAIFLLSGGQIVGNNTMPGRQRDLPDAIAIKVNDHDERRVHRPFKRNIPNQTWLTKPIFKRVHLKMGVFTPGSGPA